MTGRKQPNLSLKKVRSAVSNGRHLLQGVDARSAWMRRLRDLTVDHENDLGGADFCSESEKRLIRRAAMLTLQAEMLDAKFASNEDLLASPFDLEIYQRISNTTRRLFEALGLQRRPRPTDIMTLGDLRRLDLERQRQRERDQV